VYLRSGVKIVFFFLPKGVGDGEVKKSEKKKVGS